MRFSMLFVAGALVAAAPVLALACSSEDDAQPGDASDAAADTAANEDADPCNSYSGVGKACSISSSRICFPQCTNGGCFCQNGVWACRTDTSCFPDGTPLDDAFPTEDANVPYDGGNGDGAAMDGTSDAPADANDGATVTDAPSDADDAG